MSDYAVQTWTDFDPAASPLSAARLNYMEAGIRAAGQVANVENYGAVGDYNGTTGTDSTQGFLDAIAAVNAAGGGVVFVPPGAYKITATLELDGVVLQGATSVLRDAATDLSREVTALCHDFNGDFIRFKRSTTLTGGGGIRDLVLYNKASRTGSAIKAAANSGDVVGPSRVFIHNVTVSIWEAGSSIGFTRDVDLDGTNGTLDIRQWWFTNCQFFGCETAGETVRVTRAAAIFFNNCGIYGAPSLLTQGFKLLNSASANVFWTGGPVGGNVVTEAGPASQAGLIFTGSVEGSITCASGSARNSFFGHRVGAFTNSGAASNTFTGGTG